MTMKLYGTPPTRAIKPLWLLNELGLGYEMIVVNIPAGEHRQPAFQAINPVGKVPVLIDGHVVIAESSAITMYLAEQYGEGRFIPAASDERARMNQWNLFLITEIEQPLWRIALHTSIYPEAERRQEERTLAERDCRHMLAPLERHMANRTFLLGKEPTVADFTAAYTLDWADNAGFLDQSPNLKRFVELMYERPAAPPKIGEAFAELRRGAMPSSRRQAG